MPEKELIRRIRSHAPAGGAVIRGIGDDCALLRTKPGHELLATSDFSLEGIHFRRRWHPPESVGHRCLARGLSDVAAMGGEPLAAFLSLAIPATLQQRWLDRFLSGLLALAERFQCPLAGGDTAESPGGVLADIVVAGSVPRGQAVLRSGARPGDAVYVTGMLGRSAMALAALRSGRKLGRSSPIFAPHFFPAPRLEAGIFLRKRRLASAMIDISDGLSTDLAHLCEESGVGAVVYADRIPRLRGDESLPFALHGGEDYELLFTSSRRVPAKVAGVATTQIGEITSGKRLLLIDSAGRRRPFVSAGWEHFGNKH